MKFITTFFYPIYQSIQKPKFLKFDDFWKVYYLNQKLMNHFSFDLKYYNHNCENKNMFLLNSELNLKINKIDIKERILMQVQNNNIINIKDIHLDEYIIDIPKNLQHSELIKNKGFIYQYLYIYLFINQIEEYLQSNLPGKTIWSKEEQDKGLKLFKQILFYLNGFEKTTNFVKKINNLYKESNFSNMQNNTILIFKYNQNIRYHMIKEEILNIPDLEKDLIINKLIQYLIEINSLYE